MQLFHRFCADQMALFEKEKARVTPIAEVYKNLIHNGKALSFLHQEVPRGKNDFYSKATIGGPNPDDFQMALHPTLTIDQSG